MKRVSTGSSNAHHKPMSGCESSKKIKSGKSMHWDKDKKPKEEKTDRGTFGFK
jgi:hypothetical protein